MVTAGDRERYDVLGAYDFLGTALLLGWLCYAATYFIRQRWLRLPFQAACLTGIVLMGVSWFELGAHWPSDVLGAYLIAAVILIPAIRLHGRTKRVGD